MSLSQDFRPAPDGAGGYVAKFGRTAVTLEPSAAARVIYRDGVQVGEWPALGWRVIVHGELSTHAASLEMAKALGEYHARHSSANAWNFSPHSPRARRHAMDPQTARAAVLADIADGAALLARYPFTPAEVASLRASRHHSDILDPVPESEINRRVARLIGP